MTRYVAFLRAVNVGGRGTLKMESLRHALRTLGFENARTLMASGNAVFEAGEPAAVGVLAAKIEDHLRDELGVATTVMLRTHREIEKLVMRQPFGDEVVGRGIEYYVAFLARKPRAGHDLPIVSAKDGLEIFSIEGREAFVIRRRVAGRFGFRGEFIETALGVPATVRNWNTVVKIAEMK